MSKEFKRVLVEAFEERKIKNPRYSLRAFAKQLKLPASTVLELMNTRRSPSKRVAQTICERLFLSPEECAAIMAEKNQSHLSPENVKMLDMDSFHLISSSLHVGLISLISCDDFQNNIDWMSDRLKTSSRETQNALDRLMRLGLVQQCKTRGIKVISLNIKSSDGLTNLSLRKSHAETLDLAKESLLNDPLEVRNIRSMTMAIDPDLLPEAIQKIKKFQSELCHFLESGKKTEVYRLNINLFPLSKVKPNGEL